MIFISPFSKYQLDSRAHSAWIWPNGLCCLEWIRLYIIIDKPSHPNFYPIQIFPAKTIDVKYIISKINLLSSQ